MSDMSVPPPSHPYYTRANPQVHHQQQQLPLRVGSVLPQLARVPTSPLTPLPESPHETVVHSPRLPAFAPQQLESASLDLMSGSISQATHPMSNYPTLAPAYDSSNQFVANQPPPHPSSPSAFVRQAPPHQAVPYPSRLLSPFPQTDADPPARYGSGPPPAVDYSTRPVSRGMKSPLQNLAFLHQPQPIYPPRDIQSPPMLPHPQTPLPDLPPHRQGQYGYSYPTAPHDPSTRRYDNMTNDLLKELFEVNRHLRDELSRSRDNRPSQPLVLDSKGGGDVDLYYGKDAEKLSRFVWQLDLFYSTHPQSMSSDFQKVNYAVSRLRGDAERAIMALFRPYQMNGGVHPMNLNRAAFFSFLRSSFGDPDEMGSARRKLTELSMTGTASEYFVSLRTLTAILGYVDERQIIDRAMTGLSDTMALEVTRSGRTFHSLDELMAFCVPLDNKLRALESNRQAKSSGKSQPSTSTTKSSPPVSQIAAAQSSLPQNPSSASQRRNRPLNITSEEHDRRMSLGLCLRCGEQGHRAADCSAPSQSTLPPPHPSLPPIPQAPKV